MLLPQEAVSRRQRDAKVLFYCNHGKHRSVGCCELVAKVLRKQSAQWIQTSQSFDAHGSKDTANNTAVNLLEKEIKNLVKNTHIQKSRATQQANEESFAMFPSLNNVQMNGVQPKLLQTTSTGTAATGTEH